VKIKPGVYGCILTLALVTLSAQPELAQRKLRPAEILSLSSYLSHAQARPVFEALGEPLPAPAEWPSWIAARDRDTRARVAEGDETSIVHWLLFGTSFTDEPRVTSRQLETKNIADVVAARLDDFERALAQPGSSERLQFARKVLGNTPVRTRLLAMLDRVMKEGETHTRLAEEARTLGDPSLEFAERSRMYRARGLSSDTSLKVNFAIEQALRGLTPVLVRGSDPKRRPVRRVAIIGPGLDFSDKQEGYDFYAPQTIQPFALQDSLIRLGLADPDALEVTAFDLSPRVIAHAEYAVARARGGQSYTIHLPLDADIAWMPDFLDYWQRFGNSIGGAVPVTVPPRVGSLKLRAVSVRPPFAARIEMSDLNVTAQHLALADAERFDLIVGTNVFLYYDRLQQGLAMVNASTMLKPGGLLLSNNALVEIPQVGMRSIGYTKSLYSRREEDGDLIIWYQKSR
jgi:SAM-dependent methyltransferase